MPTDLKEALRNADPLFWAALASQTRAATDFAELVALATLRRRATRTLGDVPGRRTRIALVGGYTLHPLQDLMEQALFGAGIVGELFVGEYDNYEFELRDEASPLRAFKPEVIVVLPAERRFRYAGGLIDSRATVTSAAAESAAQLLELVARAHDLTGAEIVLANLPPPSGRHVGAFRVKAAGSPWTFRKLFNVELGLAAPSFVHVCDVDFLVTRLGFLAANDERAWFESKQPGSPSFLLGLAQEVAHLIASLRSAQTKVLVLDLDNTLWGGVIGDDGLEGIELGTTSPRGEAFRAFQEYVLELKQRGVLLAVCSKNDHATALAPFEHHPDMALRVDDLVAFYANWQPKSDNIRAIALELGLGLDSIAFVDDNPAEIDIVNQFVPEVRTVLVGPDPADYRGQLDAARLFEPLQLTAEDAARTQHYRVEAERNALKARATDMPSYLRSLAMSAQISPFTSLDAPRIAQLINKSNQFNLTTIRRTEAEVRELLTSPTHSSFTIRLSDRFGDHGLVAVVITVLDESNGSRELVVDTWLMSCRVLKRQLEEVTLNEIFRIARERSCVSVIGRYRPTAKNAMVAQLLPSFGFVEISTNEAGRVYSANAEAFTPLPHEIRTTETQR